MQINTLQRKTAHARSRRVGRGGKRGKTSGRGMKGQKSRAGGSPRPEMRDIIKKLPKKRGYGKNRARTVVANRLKPGVVNVATLELNFKVGESVTPKALRAKGLVRNSVRTVKILGNGEITKKLAIEKCTVSKSALEKINKAGGTVK